MLQSGVIRKDGGTRRIEKRLNLACLELTDLDAPWHDTSYMTEENAVVSTSYVNELCDNVTFPYCKCLSRMCCSSSASPGH